NQSSCSQSIIHFLSSPPTSLRAGSTGLGPIAGLPRAYRPGLNYFAPSELWRSWSSVVAPVGTLELNIVARLATAATAHNAKESLRKSRTALMGAAVHTDITNQRVKLTKMNPKKIRSRQHRVSE